MKNSSDGLQRPQPAGGVVSRSARSSFRALSSYFRIVSSGASTVARSAVSAASSIVDRVDDSTPDQVLWAGFDKLEGEGDITRRVLLLGYRSGFQVWDVEEADNVRDLVSKHDGPVSFLQMLPKPVVSKRSHDKFEDSRPLLVVCADASLSGVGNIQDGFATSNGSIANYNDAGKGGFVPNVVRFYSLKSHSYVHILKFRSVVYSVRCSSRVVAVSQAAQIHCFNASTLEREYNILTNTVGAGCIGLGVGYGPLAVGPRWLAYSGPPVAVTNSGRVSPQHVTPSATFSGYTPNGSLVALIAKESSKQLATGIVTLGDKLSRYCLPDSYNSLQPESPGLKNNGIVNGHSPDADNIGMVIVRDIVSKAVISQFRAHKSPISALCFDPSGTLLVTASIQGHNINVFKIMPGSLAGNNGATCVHLYRLQRGFTNAVIQDICFTNDSNWIMISSSRGTSHLFAINPSGGLVTLQSADASAKSSGSGSKPAVRWPPNLSSQLSSQQSLCAPGSPFTLSVVSRIRSGSNGWKGTLSGAATAATGRTSFVSGATASAFHNCKGDDSAENASSRTKSHLLVFSSSGCMIQYKLQMLAGHDSMTDGSIVSYESPTESDGKLLVEAVQKWNICQKQTRREREDNLDIYGENGSLDSSKIYPEEVNTRNSNYPEMREAYPKAKTNSEEKHHLYISEAELQMHQACAPLWGKHQLYFQTMFGEGVLIDEKNIVGGEIEIESIPTRMIETRPKNLVPVYDYVQNSNARQARVPVVHNNRNGLVPSQGFGQSGNDQLLNQMNTGTLDSITGRGTAVSALPHAIEETECDGPQSTPLESVDSVNNFDNSWLKNVNSIDTSQVVNNQSNKNNINGNLEQGNQFEDEDGKSDDDEVG